MNYFQIFADGFEALYRTMLSLDDFKSLFTEFQEEEERDEVLNSLGVERIFTEDVFID